MPKMKSKYLHHLYNQVEYDFPLKRSLSGYEIELSLIDEQGDISNDSDKIIKGCRAIDNKFHIQEEVAHNMIEITALPHSKVQRTSLFLINNVEQAMNVCEKHHLACIPLACYPGKFKEKMRKKKRYQYSANAIGKDAYNHFYPRCYGFHYHYALPRGVFNQKQEFLNKHDSSKIQHTLLDSYNFLIAADPALTTLCQSSPFEGGKYYGKDTRMLYWRGGRKLKFDGVFSKLQLLGGLQPYKHTVSDLKHTLKMKDEKAVRLFEKSGAPKSFIEKKSRLDLIWNPVKVNKHGTLEQRGLDTNLLSINLGVSVMMKFILRAIQQDFYHVIPSDLALDEPFKLEGNIIFIPPQTHVRNNLQYKSAYFGLSDKDMVDYCNRFYNLAKKLVYKEYIPALRTIKNIIDKKMTISDKIIQYVKKSGYTLNQNIPQEICRKISLNYSKRLRRDIERVKKIYDNTD